MPEDMWNRESMTEAVYFLHIEKTAGSSVHRFLTAAFPDALFCPTRLREELDGVNAATLRKYRLFSGHLTGGFTDFLGMPLKTITLLRDPVQRSISHYAHVRRDPSSPFHALAQGLSLREFCLHPETRPLIEEYQARCLAGAALEAPLRRVDPDPIPRSREMREDLLRRARATLDSCIAVGVTERLADALTIFADILGLEWSGVTPYENASYNRPKTVDPETLAVIRELTQCDTILHREAMERLRQQLSESGHSRAHRALPLAASAGGGHRGKRGGFSVAARLAWPERAHRAKLNLSAALCRAPRAMRVALASLYMGYRLLVDRKVSLVSRIPLLLGLLYLVSPLDLFSSRIFVVDELDEAAAVVAGILVSLSLISNRIIDDVKLAAMTRFDLGSSRYFKAAAVGQGAAIGSTDHAKSAASSKLAG